MAVNIKRKSWVVEVDGYTFEVVFDCTYGSSGAFFVVSGEGKKIGRGRIKAMAKALSEIEKVEGKS